MKNSVDPYCPLGFPGGSDGKVSTCNVGDPGSKPGDPGSKLKAQDPWKREWLLTPIFMLGEFHGQRSLSGCRPWDHKELEKTEQLTFFILPTRIVSNHK